MTTLNVDDFYKDAAIGLLQLMTVFPRKHTLFVEDIIGPDEPDEFGLHSPRHEACLSALLWLADEGYIRYVDTVRQEAIDQAVLTNKALVILQSLYHTPQKQPETFPPSLTVEGNTNAAQLKAAVKAGNAEKIKAIMHFITSLGDTTHTRQLGYQPYEHDYC